MAAPAPGGGGMGMGPGGGGGTPGGASNGLKDALQQRQGQPPAQRLPISEQSAAATLAANGSGVLAKRKVQELVEQVSPGETIDTEVEEVLLEIAEDFVENVTNFACLLAKHRKSQVLEVQDIKLHLEKHWGIKVAGFSGTEERAQKKAATAPDGQPKRAPGRPPGQAGGPPGPAPGGAGMAGAARPGP